jgi:hypothetical protein
MLAERKGLCKEVRKIFFRGWKLRPIIFLL